MEIPGTPLPLPSAAQSREPRSLPAAQGASFWGEAWRIFLAAPLPWILVLLVYVVLSVAVEFVPVLGGVAQIVLTPVFAGGMMLGCHALARGEPLTVSHLFDGFRDGRFGPLAMLGLILLAVSIVFGIVLLAGAFMTIGMSGLNALTGQGDPMALAGSIGIGSFVVLLIALLGGFVIAMAVWFAPALVVLDGVEPLVALKKSFDACMTNIGAFTVYGLIYIGLAILATIPVGLGWFVLGPMIVGSAYAGWRQIFGA